MNVHDAIAPLAGGALIGLAASSLLVLEGRIAGVSGVLGGLLERGDRGWRAAFLGGLFVGGLVLQGVAPEAIGLPVTSGIVLLIAGLLVGFGTRMAGGCTSGHGLCGNARLSLRSFVATITFMACAMVVTFVLRHVVA